MFKSQHSYFGGIACPAMLQGNPCLLPNCIFSHETPRKRSIESLDQLESPLVAEKKKPKNDLELQQNLPEDTADVEEEEDLHTPDLSSNFALLSNNEYKNPKTASASTASIPASSSYNTLSDASARVNKLPASSASSTKTIPQAAKPSKLLTPNHPPVVSLKASSPLDPRTKAIPVSRKPAEILRRPSHNASLWPASLSKPATALLSSKYQSTPSANSRVQTRVFPSAAASSKVTPKSTTSSSVGERVDAATLTPMAVVPFAPAPFQQRVGYLKVIVRELEAKKVRFPKRIAIKLEYDIAKSSSKIIYPNKVRKLVVDIKNDKFGRAGQQKAAEEKTAKEEKLKEQLRKGLEELLIPDKVLESHEYVVGLIIPKPIDDDFIATCERCHAKFMPSSKKAQSTCFYHWARLQYDCKREKL